MFRIEKAKPNRHCLIGLLVAGLSACAVVPPVPAATDTTPVAAVAAAEASTVGRPLSGLPRAVLVINGHRAEVQLAISETERSTGLKYRTAMPENEGMLLVFAEEAVHCLWMHETVLPLSAAFVRGDGRIVRITDMQPLSQEVHCSPEPVRYALEMHRGWFARHGIGRHSVVAPLPAFR